MTQEYYTREATKNLEVNSLSPFNSVNYFHEYSLPSCFRYEILGSQNVCEIIETFRNSLKCLENFSSVGKSVWNVMKT